MDIGQVVEPRKKQSALVIVSVVDTLTCTYVWRLRVNQIRKIFQAHSDVVQVGGTMRKPINFLSLII